MSARIKIDTDRWLGRIAPLIGGLAQEIARITGL